MKHVHVHVHKFSFGLSIGADESANTHDRDVSSIFSFISRDLHELGAK